MSNPKRILVVCGTGIATATLVAEILKSALAERGVAIATCTCHSDNAAQKAQEFQPDCIVSTAYLNGHVSVPVFRGLPFLTGVKEDEVLTELVAYLAKPVQPSS